MIFEGIGYWDVLDDPRSVVCVEWLNTIWEAWPNRGVIVELEQVQGHRLAHVYVTSRRADTMRATLERLTDSLEVQS